MGISLGPIRLGFKAQFVCQAISSDRHLAKKPYSQDTNLRLPIATNIPLQMHLKMPLLLLVCST